MVRKMDTESHVYNHDSEISKASALQTLNKQDALHSGSIHTRTISWNGSSNPNVRKIEAYQKGRKDTWREEDKGFQLISVTRCLSQSPTFPMISH